MLKLNPVFTNTKESATLAINQQVKAMRSEGKSVYHFGFGESPFPMPDKLVQSLIEYAHLNQYLPCAGLYELRETVSQFMANEFNLNHFNADSIFVGPGSKELIFQIIYCLQHEVLIPAPSWVSYLPQTILAQKGYQIIPTLADNNYCLSAEALQKVADPNKPQILILNSPNNPTGAVYPKVVLQQLAEVCRENNMIVLSDEIYAAVNFTGNPHASIAHHYPEGTIVTTGISKMFSGGGYRLGFACIPEELSALAAPLKTIISETYSSVSTPIQYAANELLSDPKAIHDYLDKTVQIHQYVSNYIATQLDKTKIKHSITQGAFYLLVDFSNYRDELKARGIHTDVELGQYLLDQYQFAALPGSDFYLKPEDLCFRITTVDYDGKQALNADQLSESLFPNIVGGMKQLQKFSV